MCQEKKGGRGFVSIEECWYLDKTYIKKRAKKDWLQRPEITQTTQRSTEENN